jgi:hypothetical protein
MVQASVVATLPACMWEVPSLKLGWITSCDDRDFCGFPQCLLENTVHESLHLKTYHTIHKGCSISNIQQLVMHIYYFHRYQTEEGIMDKPSASPHNNHSNCDVGLMLYFLFISHENKSRLTICCNSNATITASGVDNFSLS